MSYTGNVVRFGASGRVGPTYLTAEEAARALLKAGFTRGQAEIALAVMTEESWLSPDAEGDLLIQDEEWGPSIGLMQIRSRKAELGKGTARDAKALKDPARNLKEAKALFDQAGFKPWGAFSSGRYSRHLSHAEEVFAGLSDGGNMARSVKSLLKLLAEIDSIAPQRNKAWDGWIGDAAHASRHSDHNPEPDGTVDARDFTHDPTHGADMNEISARIVANKDPRVSYLIWNRRICSGNRGPSPWVWRPYGGSNPHDHHLHVSVLDANQDDESPWLTEEEDFPMDQPQFDKLMEGYFQNKDTKGGQLFKAAYSSLPVGANGEKDLVEADTLIRALAQALNVDIVAAVKALRGG